MSNSLTGNLKKETNNLSRFRRIKKKKQQQRHVRSVFFYFASLVNVHVGNSKQLNEYELI